MGWHWRQQKQQQIVGITTTTAIWLSLIFFAPYKQGIVLSSYRDCYHVIATPTNSHLRGKSSAATNMSNNKLRITVQIQSKSHSFLSHSCDFAFCIFVVVVVVHRPWSALAAAAAKRGRRRGRGLCVRGWGSGKVMFFFIRCCLSQIISAVVFVVSLFLCLYLCMRQLFFLCIIKLTLNLIV